VSVTNLDLLGLDIDLRILGVWEELNQLSEPFSEGIVAASIRAAYGKGYCDALREPLRGQMCHDHGLPVPERKCS
jgi:hypothetical protein